MWSFVKKSVLWWDRDIHLANTRGLIDDINQTNLLSNSPVHIRDKLKEAISPNNLNAAENSSENIRNTAIQLCNNISVAGYKKQSNDTVASNHSHNQQKKDDNDSEISAPLLPNKKSRSHSTSNSNSEPETNSPPDNNRENRPSFWQRVKNDQAKAKQKVFRLVALEMYRKEMHQKRKDIINESQNALHNDIEVSAQNAEEFSADNNSALDNLSLDALYAVHFTLWLREALNNPEHLLHKQMALKWLLHLRSITSDVVNPLLQITYEGRMTLIDTFRNGKNMSAFEQYDYGVLFNSVTGDPLMFVRDLYYAKGALLEIHYFIYWWRHRNDPNKKIPFHYTIGFMFANDIMWCGMNTANITSDIIQIIHAAKHHIAYTDPMFKILGQSLSQFGFVFDIGYAIDLFRDLLCNLKAYLNESDPIIKKRLGWAMLRNFLSNLGMLFARIVLSFNVVALALASGCAIAVPALFLGAVGYSVWRLSKIKGKKTGWAIALGAFSLVAAGLGIGLLMGASLLAGGILFGLGAIGFGIATYKYLNKKGVDKATSLRVAVMFGAWGILAVGVAAFVLFGAPFIAAVASASILGVMLVGLFRELCKLVRVVEACVQKEQMLEMQNNLIKEANESANDDGLEKFALSDNEEDWIDNMLLMEELTTTHGEKLNHESGLDSDQQEKLKNDLRSECVYYLSDNRNSAINNFKNNSKVDLVADAPNYEAYNKVNSQAVI